LQVPSWQTEALHTPEALAYVQAVAQLPQCAALVASAVSQPLPKFASQLPYPAVQAMPQTPPVQLAVPLIAPQTVLQLPQ